MKRFAVLLVGVIFLFVGCAGMSLFPNKEPLCTPEEQATSIIYKYVDPATADFTLLLGVATLLDKDPTKAPLIEQILMKAQALVESGISYELFSKELVGLLGPMQFVVINPLLAGFQNFSIPIKPCDKKLMLGHIENQLQLVRLVQ